MARGGRATLEYAATAAAIVALIAILVIVSNVIAKPLGTVIAFALGAFLVTSRADLSEEAHVAEWWLGALGVLLAVAVPLLLIVA